MTRPSAPKSSSTVPLSAQTIREMEKGARQVAIHARTGNLRRNGRNQQRKKASGKNLGVLVPKQLPNDPAVKLPSDIQSTIARGNAAFRRQGHFTASRNPKRGRKTPTIITSVIDQEIQDRRDANLDARDKAAEGKRRQPPMTNRLRAVMVVVDRLMSEGVPFGVGPNSRMNKAVLKWLNDRAKRSGDTRKSRRKEITPTAVRALLKQAKAEGQKIVKPKTRKLTFKEKIRELRRQLYERQASETD